MLRWCHISESRDWQLRQELNFRRRRSLRRKIITRHADDSRSGTTGGKPGALAADSYHSGGGENVFSVPRKFTNEGVIRVCPSNFPFKCFTSNNKEDLALNKCLIYIDQIYKYSNLYFIHWLSSLCHVSMSLFISSL